MATGDPLFDWRYVEAIQKVTAEQIRDAARRYFVPERLNRVIIAPPGGAPKPPGPEAKAAKGAVRMERLANGLRVLLARHTNLPLVEIQAYVLAGSLVDSEETAGRSTLVGAMLDKGTRQFTAAQIAEFFDSIGGRFHTGAGRNSVFASATVLREDFSRALAMLAECFTQPTFPAEEFEKARQLALRAIARRSDDPHQEALELFYDALPATTPYHVIQGGKPETVRRLTVEDLRAYHARYFVPGNMIVAVFGDVDPEESLRLVQQHFGHLKPDPHFVPIDFSRDNAIPRPAIRHKQTGKPTGIIVLGYPGASILNRQEDAAMIVLDAIISGYNCPGGWLFNELRGRGLVYTVDAVQITGPAPGYLVIFAQTRPENLDEVLQRIQSNVERARSGHITPEEFAAAKDMVVALHLQENTTLGAQAQLAAMYEMYGLGYEYDKTFEERIRAVRLEDVVRIARKCLNHYVLVTTSPKPASPRPPESK